MKCYWKDGTLWRASIFTSFRADTATRYSQTSTSLCSLSGNQDYRCRPKTCGFSDSEVRNSGFQTRTFRLGTRLLRLELGFSDSELSTRYILALIRWYLRDDLHHNCSFGRSHRRTGDSFVGDTWQRLLNVATDSFYRCLPAQQHYDVRAYRWLTDVLPPTNGSLTAPL